MNRNLTIPKLLKARNASLSEIAKDTDHSLSNIKAILNGNPTIDKLREIANALKVPLTALLDSSEQIVESNELSSSIFFSRDDVVLQAMLPHIKGDEFGSGVLVLFDKYYISIEPQQATTNNTKAFSKDQIKINIREYRMSSSKDNYDLEDDSIQKALSFYMDEYTKALSLYKKQIGVSSLTRRDSFTEHYFLTDFSMDEYENLKITLRKYDFGSKKHVEEIQTDYFEDRVTFFKNEVFYGSVQFALHNNPSNPRIAAFFCPRNPVEKIAITKGECLSGIETKKLIFKLLND